MKQFHVETLNRQTGEWMLAHRVKCHYRLGYVRKAWCWPLDCTVSTRLVILDQEHSELVALGKAMQLATYLGRRRRVAGTSVIASIRTRIVRLEFHPRQADVIRTTIWENLKSTEKVGTNGPVEA